MSVLQSVLSALWHTLQEMAPYLLFGFFIAGLLSVLIPTSFVQKHLGRGKWLPSLKAALFGVPLPLCSCGVIPVAASLKRQGASPGATSAFLLSTPQTGVDSMLVTYSLLGLTFALFTPVAALLSGVLVGLMVTLLIKEPPRMVDLSLLANDTPESCCSSKKASESHSPRWVRQAMRHGFITLPKDIAVPLMWGLLIAGLLSALVPSDFFAQYNTSGWTIKWIMLAAGIPMYVCATASVPIAASLIAVGLSPGSAFVFLMSGPATNAVTLTTIWKLMGRKTLFIYLSVVVVSALTAGMVLDQIVMAVGPGAEPLHHDMLPQGFRAACAVLLIAVLAYAKFSVRRSAKKASSARQGCC